ncbi:MAG: sugar phosphate isomerase/epimerase [Chitinophagaceae bacterium]|nr:sugar phosphate isomerase/epimerase [Chitinophagaceae bacterium]
MNFGINTFLFKSPFTTESVSLFPKFKRWGFDSVEIALEEASHIDPKVVKKALADNGLICGSMCGAMGAGRDLRGSEKEQQTSLDYLKSVMDAMAEVGTPVLAGPLYSSVGRAEATEENEYKRQWETVVDHLKTLADYAKKLNIRLAIEPLNRYETDFINTCEQAMKMVNDVDSDAISVHLDSYHMNIEEKDSPKAILMAGKKLGHFHACGTDRGTPGNDHTNWDGIVSAIKQINYDGGVVIESFTTDVKVIAKAASIWRKFEPSQEDIAIKGIQFLHSCFA